MTHPDNTTVVLPLTQGMSTIVDACDAEYLGQFRWCLSRGASGLCYAMRSARINGRWTTTYMHREITLAGPGEVVDHKDGDGLNNRRSNLRKATSAQNKANVRVDRINNTTGYKGVYRIGTSNRWCAQIAGRYIGCYRSPEEAALAYDEAARALYGEFARTNFH